jgi:hypothetical protein
MQPELAGGARLQPAENSSLSLGELQPATCIKCFDVASFLLAQLGPEVVDFVVLCRCLNLDFAAVDRPPDDLRAPLIQVDERPDESFVPTELPPHFLVRVTI